MILIIILLLFAFYMFWRFDQRRKIRNAAHQREKREALTNLLLRLRQQVTFESDQSKTGNDEP
jgi:hypothetical protein